MLQSDKGAIPENMTRWNNDVLMLAQRLRRWLNIIDHGFNVSCLLGCHAAQPVITSCLTSKQLLIKHNVKLFYITLKVNNYCLHLSYSVMANSSNCLLESKWLLLFPLKLHLEGKQQ